jgi:hypothetical protein
MPAQLQTALATLQSWWMKLAFAMLLGLRKDDRGVRMLKCGRGGIFRVGVCYALGAVFEFGLCAEIWSTVRFLRYSRYISTVRVWWPLVAVLVAGSAVGLLALSMLRLYFRVRNLVSVTDLARALGTTPEELAAFAETRDVRPTYCINGDDMYDPADMADLTTLLRASAAPEPAAESLLRAAKAKDEATPETLLRPTAAILPETPPAVRDAQVDDAALIQRLS